MSSGSGGTLVTRAAQIGARTWGNAQDLCAKIKLPWPMDYIAIANSIRLLQVTIHRVKERNLQIS